MLRVSSAAIGAALVPAQRLPAQRAGAVSTVASARPSSRGQCVIVVATNGGRRPGARRSSTGNRNNPSSPQSPQRDGQAAPPAVKIGSAGSAPQKAGPQSPAPATVVAAAPATLQPAKAVPVAAAAPATAAALAAEKAPVAVASASSTVAESGSAPGTPQKADEKPSAKKNKYNLQGEEDFDGLVHVDYSDWGEDEYVIHDDAVPKDFHFEPRSRVTLKLTPEKLERAARRSRRDFIYEHTLSELCIELVKFQEYVKANGLKVCVLFEGRDAAGKGGIISRIAAAMSPRVCKVVALTAPNERERTQWYFQRYVQHLPAAGEIVLFDRSWYNRAGVEKVMGFCKPDQYEHFMKDVPLFERMLVENAKIILVKYWLDVSDHEQERRFQGRLHRSWKRWKLSPMDLFARSKWTEYAFARDEMLRRTSPEWAPWWVIPSDDKKLARLNCISDLLSRVKYTEIPQEHLSLPPRDSDVPEGQRNYRHPPLSEWNIVPQIYTKRDLLLNDIVGYESHEDDDDDVYYGAHSSMID